MQLMTSSSHALKQVLMLRSFRVLYLRIRVPYVKTFLDLVSFELREEDGDWSTTDVTSRGERVGVFNAPLSLVKMSSLASCVETFGSSSCSNFSNIVSRIASRFVSSRSRKRTACFTKFSTSFEARISLAKFLIGTR